MGPTWLVVALYKDVLLNAIVEEFTDENKAKDRFNELKDSGTCRTVYFAPARVIYRAQEPTR